MNNMIGLFNISNFIYFDKEVLVRNCLWQFMLSEVALYYEEEDC